MVKDPTISVVIPTYKRPEKLSRAIQSVFQQTYDDWELIIVNDAPDVDVDNVIPESEKTTYIHHQENRGAQIARNNGIKAASGQYIALLDDDDAWKPAKLSRQIELFNQLDDDFELIYTGTDIIYKGEIIKEQIPQKEGWVLNDILYHNFIPSESPLIRKECFDNVGMFDPDFQSCQDMDMWIRISKEYKIAGVQESLAMSYLGHSERISKNPKMKYQGHKKLIQKHQRELEANPEALAIQRKNLGLYAAMMGKKKESIINLYNSYIEDKTDIAIILYIILATLPKPIRKKTFSIREEIVNRI